MLSFQLWLTLTSLIKIKSFLPSKKPEMLRYFIGVPNAEEYIILKSQCNCEDYNINNITTSITVADHDLKVLWFKEKLFEFGLAKLNSSKQIFIVIIALLFHSYKHKLNPSFIPCETPKPTCKIENCSNMQTYVSS